MRRPRRGRIGGRGISNTITRVKVTGLLNSTKAAGRERQQLKNPRTLGPSPSASVLTRIDTK
jgi:hypothetical protein